MVHMSTRVSGCEVSGFMVHCTNVLLLESWNTYDILYLEETLNWYW